MVYKKASKTNKYLNRNDFRVFNVSHENANEAVCTRGG
jgi:hypothetical protein